MRELTITKRQTPGLAADLLANATRAFIPQIDPLKLFLRLSIKRANARFGQ